MMTRILTGAACALLFPTVAAAQVGHTPQTSPYRDVEFRQELTWLGGYYQAAKDPGGVAPRSGPMAGVHYELHLAGPAYFTTRIAGVMSERNVIDPTKPLVERNLGTKNVTLLQADVGFALNLTGAKSWHGLVPTVGGGAGIGSGLDGADVGGFKVGTPFLLTVRPGIKFGVPGRWTGRLEATNIFHRLKYPESYFIKTGADPAVFLPEGSRTSWKRDVGFALGLTRAFGR